MPSDIIRLAARAKTSSEQFACNTKAAKLDSLATQMMDEFSGDASLSMEEQLVLSKLIGGLRIRANRIRSIGQFISLTTGGAS